MYPTISDLIKDLFGIYIPLPVQSFGFFVALSFILGAYALSLELKRKERQGLLSSVRKKVLVGEPANFQELAVSGLIGFILGFKGLEAVLHYGALVENPQSFILSLRGSIPGGIAACALAAYLKYREKNLQKLPKPKYVEQEVHPHQLLGNMVLIAAIAGLLGAKFFHNLENPAEFIADPIAALFSFSGLTFYGGLICGTFAVLYYAGKNGIAVLYMLDASGPGLMLAYGIGRIGCQIAGDGDWGIPNDLPQPGWISFLPEWVWAYNYPNNVLGIDLQQSFVNDGYQSITGKAFPTPLYEAVLGIGFFCLLWAIRKKISVPGMLFSIYLLLNGTERFFIEKIRVNTMYHIFSYKITQAEIISSMIILAGIAGIIYFSRKVRSSSSYKF